MIPITLQAGVCEPEDNGPDGQWGRLKRVQTFDEAVAPSMKSENKYYLKQTSGSETSVSANFFFPPSSSNTVTHPQLYLQSAFSAPPISTSEDVPTLRNRLWYKCLKWKMCLLYHVSRNLSFFVFQGPEWGAEGAGRGVERMRFHLLASNTQLNFIRKIFLVSKHLLPFLQNHLLSRS